MAGPVRNPPLICFSGQRSKKNSREELWWVVWRARHKYVSCRPFKFQKKNCARHPKVVVAGPLQRPSDHSNVCVGPNRLAAPIIADFTPPTTLTLSSIAVRCRRHRPLPPSSSPSWLPPSPSTSARLIIALRSSASFRRHPRTPSPSPRRPRPRSAASPSSLLGNPRRPSSLSCRSARHPRPRPPWTHTAAAAAAAAFN